MSGPVYRFQQAEWGNLWAMPVEPVHPKTRCMFWRYNQFKRHTSSASDTCWCNYPAQNLAGEFFEYFDGRTGLYHRVDVNEVLDAHADENGMVLHPIDVPLNPVQDISHDWEEEREMAAEGGYQLADSWRNDRENCKPVSEG